MKLNINAPADQAFFKHLNMLGIGIRVTVGGEPCLRPFELDTDISQEHDMWKPGFPAHGPDGKKGYVHEYVMREDDPALIATDENQNPITRTRYGTVEVTPYRKEGHKYALLPDNRSLPAPENEPTSHTTPNLCWKRDDSELFAGAFAGNQPPVLKFDGAPYTGPVGAPDTHTPILTPYYQSPEPDPTSDCPCGQCVPDQGPVGEQAGGPAA